MKENNEKSLIEKIIKYLPTVETPKYQISTKEKIKWTALVLGIYFLLSYTTLFGIEPRAYEQFRFFEIVLGSRFGTLTTLGIAPIVTAGIIMQLLVGSKIINWDLTEPENRKKFQAWNKFLAIVFAFLEGFVYVISNTVPASSAALVPIVALQLAAGAIIIILLDEIVSKYGIGSGVSLFIAAGVASQIVIRMFSPFPSTCTVPSLELCIPTLANPPTGLFWEVIIGLLTSNLSLVITTLIPIISTIVVFAVVAYTQSIRVEIPLEFGAARGFGRVWPLNLFYTSNIPVILAAALIANLQLFGRVGLVETEPGVFCNLLGCYDAAGNAISGLAYYLTVPTNFLINLFSGIVTVNEIIRAIFYLFFFTALCIIFSIFWVNTSGMDATSVAEQIEAIGFHIPGFRSHRKVIENMLNKYIPALTFLGGLLVGLLAVFADFTGAIGTGTGILLTVMILYNFYEVLKQEPEDQLPTWLKKVMY